MWFSLKKQPKKQPKTASYKTMFSNIFFCPFLFTFFHCHMNFIL